MCEHRWRDRAGAHACYLPSDHPTLCVCTCGAKTERWKYEHLSGCPYTLTRDGLCTCASRQP